MRADPRATTILVADDSDVDVMLLCLAIRDAHLTHALVLVPDGQDAIEYLQRQGPVPDLLLLDLHMPRVSGFGVLQWLQSHPELGRVPAIIYSSSEQQEDKQRAKQLGATDYLVKTADFKSFVVDLDTRFLRKE